MHKGFDAMYAQYAAMVYWTTYGVIHEHHAAMELMQTVFLKALERGDSVCALGSRQQKSWLFKCARNAAIDRLRHERPLELGEPPAGARDMDMSGMPEEVLEQGELSRTVWRELNALPAIYRDPIILHYFAELSTRDGAKALRVNEGTYRSRLTRARAMLGASLGRETEVNGVDATAEHR
ncbi:MAG: sigma-70 family RNA polymerase sigma factor [Bacillota bacterium]